MFFLEQIGGLPRRLFSPGFFVNELGEGNGMVNKREIWIPTFVVKWADLDPEVPKIGNIGGKNISLKNSCILWGAKLHEKNKLQNQDALYLHHQGNDEMRVFPPQYADSWQM